MAEAASASQGILWNIRERRQDPNLCSHHRLLPRCDSTGGVETRDGYL